MGREGGGWVSETGWMDRETIGWTGGWPDRRVNGAGRRGWVNGPDGWTDGRTDGWMDGETIGLTGGPTDGWVGRSFDGSMVNGPLCECGCMVHEYVVDG